MKRLAFDIETMPDPERLCYMPAPEVALGNLKDPAKIAEKEAEAKRRQVERAALHPHFGRVLCISVAERSKDECFDDEPVVAHTSLIAAATDDAERDLLRWFWDRARQSKNYVTFNGAAFDVPFLLRRSLLLGVRPARIETGKYRVTDPGCEHLDLCRLLNGDESDPCGISRNLRWYANEILHEDCPYSSEFDKTDMGKLLAAGQLDIIRQVCSWDCSATLRIGEAVECVYA